MTVTVEDVVAHLRRQRQERAEAAAARERQLAAKLPEARRLLTEELGASRVLLFGSLATGRTTPTSDVDLAVEGLSSESYFDALARLMKLFEAGVDLVRLEEAKDALRLVVEQEGREL